MTRSRARLSDLVIKVRHERHAIQRFLSRKTFRFFERFGFHVVGNHFYEPIPDLGRIDEWWSDAPKPCHGIDLRREESEAYLIDLLANATSYPSTRRFGFREANPSYTSVDAMALYCFLRTERPATVVEIGQGWSTRVIVAALTDNHRDGDQRPRIVTIDPHPRIDATSLDTTIDVDSRRTAIETAPEIAQQELHAGDLLFIDSSHVHKPGSDTELVFDELLPSLPAGAFAHLHDIYTPFRYPRDWYVRDRRFWNEGEHLENFLRFNRDFEVILPLQLLVRESMRLDAWWDPAVRGPKEASAFYVRRVTPTD